MSAFKIRYALGNSDDFQRTIVLAKDEAEVRDIYSDSIIYEIEKVDEWKDALQSQGYAPNIVSEEDADALRELNLNMAEEVEAELANDDQWLQSQPLTEQQKADTALFREVYPNAPVITTTEEWRKRHLSKD